LCDRRRRELHVYVDAAADLDVALSIVVNAKTQRPGVCNAAESSSSIGPWPRPSCPGRQRHWTGSNWSGTSGPVLSSPIWQLAADKDFATEFLDLKLSVAVVDGLDGAIDHIARYGSGHTEAIVTTDLRAAERFCREVDAGAVVVNASTRFIDGGELGLGRRSVSPPRSSTPEGPWECASSPARSTWCTGTGRCGGEHHRRAIGRPPQRHTDPARFPEPGPPRFESVSDVRTRLAEVGYLADDGIAGVVYLADRLAKPVLVEGPAGTGKTELAKSVASITDSRLIRLQCYEGLDESKALYEWNYKKQLLRIQAQRVVADSGDDQTPSPDRRPWRRGLA